VRDYVRSSVWLILRILIIRILIILRIISSSDVCDESVNHYINTVRRVSTYATCILRLVIIIIIITKKHAFIMPVN
jgi:hypothetical protein